MEIGSWQGPNITGICRTDSCSLPDEHHLIWLLGVLLLLLRIFISRVSLRYRAIDLFSFPRINVRASTQCCSALFLLLVL